MDLIFVFLTQNIWFSLLKLNILDTKILIEDPEHKLNVPWSILIPYHPCHLGNFDHIIFRAVQEVKLLILVPLLSHFVIYYLGFYLVIKEVVEFQFIVATKILSYVKSSSAACIGHIYNTSDSFMSDRTDSTILPNSFSTIEQAIKHAYSFAQAQDAQSTPSLTSPLIHKTYNISCYLTMDFKRSILSVLVTMSNPAKQLPFCQSDTLVQANSSYFCLLMGHTPAEIKELRWLSRKNI